ncbi:NACHT domain-containing protein [uncultured Thermanaerothrix sp.]|uniref:NACHT domain-containing protein n=1 Tax=uncultured Thermanaerothrix sp. TaxID=1195149 RepID=UPI002629D149|nr:NACHT domain-containing protein [uncultured Thermanaerothrix sp.]
MSGEDFCLELFTRPEHYEETPLRDRKSWINLGDREGQAEFLRDFIALANTARLFGKPAYLLLGINDKGEIVGIDEMIKLLGLQGLEDYHIAEKIRNRVSNLIRKYITPLHPRWEFKFCRTEEKKALGYFQIAPIPSEPFRVKQNFGYPGGSLQPEQCWIRMGESKQEVTLREISPEQAPYCYSYAQVPYLLPRCWRDYMNGCIDELNLNSYIESRYIEVWTESGSLLEEEVKKFLNDSNTRWLIIEGVAGSGKTLFLKRWIRQQAENNLAAIDEIIRREEYSPPVNWIPVYFRLGQRDHIGNQNDLATQLLDNINSKGNFWEKRPSNPEHLFEYNDLKWLFCLDGLDEIYEVRKIEQFIRGLRGFLERFPRVKVVLTTRPGFAGLLGESDPGKIIRIKGFNPKQVESYIAKCLAASSIDLKPENVEDIIRYLRSDPDLEGLCTLPVYLEAAIEEILGVPVPPLEFNGPITAEASEPIRAESDENLSSRMGHKERISSLSSIRPDLKVKLEDMILESEDQVPISEEPSSIGSKDDDMEREYLAYSLPRRAVLIDRIYQRLWNREINRRVGKERDLRKHFTNVGELALSLDGHSEACPWQDAQKFCTQKGLEWILNMGGVLVENESGWVRFYNELTKTYFAASFVKPYVIENNVDQKVRRQICKCSPEFRERVRELLAELVVKDPDPTFSC